jgi:hypothetical protein
MPEVGPVVLNLDPAQVADLIRKNSGISYGLTIVAGLPFSPEATGVLAAVQRQVEEWLPGRFRWYGPDHLHASIYAPLRSQDRPLRREDLPPDLDGFARDLRDVIAGWPPFTLALAGVQLGPDGALIVGEDSLESRLVSRLSRHPQAAAPKHARGLATVIGFLGAPEPFRSGEERVQFEGELAGLRDVEIGPTAVDRLWLVHYDHRTLSHIIGKAPLELGHRPARHPDGAELLAELRIAA